MLMKVMEENSKKSLSLVENQPKGVTPILMQVQTK
jgi:hypothetical protein